MNKRGATLFIVLLAVIYFMFGMLFYQFLKPDITQARTDLVCAAPDTNGDKFTCLILDGIVPYFVIAILSATGGYITDKALT